MLRLSGKGGPYGKQSKKRVVPLSRRLQALLEPYFALHERWFVGPRQVQKIVKRVAERARISQKVTPHVLKAHLRHDGPAERHLAGCRSEHPRP
jgi:integrase/recombinase XerD